MEERLYVFANKSDMFKENLVEIKLIANSYDVAMGIVKGFTDRFFVFECVSIYALKKEGKSDV